MGEETDSRNFNSPRWGIPDVSWPSDRLIHACLIYFSATHHGKRVGPMITTPDYCWFQLFTVHLSCQRRDLIICEESTDFANVRHQGWLISTVNWRQDEWQETQQECRRILREIHPARTLSVLIAIRAPRLWHIRKLRILMKYYVIKNVIISSSTIKKITTSKLDTGTAQYQCQADASKKKLNNIFSHELSSILWNEAKYSRQTTYNSVRYYIILDIVTWKKNSSSPFT